MIQSIIKFLGGIASAVGAFFQYKNSPVKQREATKEAYEDEERAFAEHRAEVNRAVHEGDVDKINSLIAKSVCFCLISATLLTGCFSGKTIEYKVLRVPSDRYVTVETNAVGMVQYYKVPPSVMEDLLMYKHKAELLEKELKINERTTK